jgi:hypothetical protein
MFEEYLNLRLDLPKRAMFKLYTPSLIVSTAKDHLLI